MILCGLLSIHLRLSISIWDDKIDFWTFNGHYWKQSAELLVFITCLRAESGNYIRSLFFTIFYLWWALLFKKNARNRGFDVALGWLEGGSCTKLRRENSRDKEPVGFVNKNRKSNTLSHSYITKRVLERICSILSEFCSHHKTSEAYSFSFTPSLSTFKFEYQKIRLQHTKRESKMWPSHFR